MDPINKTMDRNDLFRPEAYPVINDLNKLIVDLSNNNLHISSWYGTVPNFGLKKKIFNWMSGRSKIREVIDDLGNRGPEYVSLPGAADDAHFPWFLYWEISWVLRCGPNLEKPLKILDAGGASSLLSCYLALKDHSVYSIDLNKGLTTNSQKIARSMRWKLDSQMMDMRKLDYDNEFFDCAYSICVFEHLNYDARQLALAEIARCLKPNGFLSITFDYCNPKPFITDLGQDDYPLNLLNSEEDIRRSFLSSSYFKLCGNEEFLDNGNRYLIHPELQVPYTFGAIFLQKKI